MVIKVRHQPVYPEAAKKLGIEQAKCPVRFTIDEKGETPVAFVVLKPGADAESVRADCNAKVGKTQRISSIAVVDELPRSPIGKVLKRELRDAYAA